MQPKINIPMVRLHQNFYNDLQFTMKNEQNSFSATFNLSLPLCTDTSYSHNVSDIITEISRDSDAFLDGKF